MEDCVVLSRITYNGWFEIPLCTLRFHKLSRSQSLSELLKRMPDVLARQVNVRVALLVLRELGRAQSERHNDRRKLRHTLTVG